MQQLLRPSASFAAALGQQTRAINFYGAPNGPAVKLENIEDEWFNRQRPKLSLLDKSPWTQPDTWIAPNAVVAGDVDIYDQAGLWSCSMRVDGVDIMQTVFCTGRYFLWSSAARGSQQNQDWGLIGGARPSSDSHGTVSRGYACWNQTSRSPCGPVLIRAVPTGLNPATLIAEYVTIEPYCVLRACRIESKVIIGARSVICEGAIVESGESPLLSHRSMLHGPLNMHSCRCRVNPGAMLSGAASPPHPGGRAVGGQPSALCQETDRS